MLANSETNHETKTQEHSTSTKDKAKLNPAVLPSGSVRRYFVTTENRGATPPVVISNPDTPYFDPYNHEFPNSDATVHNKGDINFSGGWTALHAAAEAKLAGPHPPETIDGPDRAQALQPVQGDIPQAKFLLAGLGHHVPASLSFPHYSSPKIDPDSALTKNGYTPLILAVRSGHEAMVATLIEHNATIDVQDAMGRTALHHACEVGNTAITKLLLAAADATHLGTLTARIQSAADLVPPAGLAELSPYCSVSVLASRHIILQTQRTAVKSHTRRPEWHTDLVFRSCPANARVELAVLSSPDGVEHVPVGAWMCPLAALPADQTHGIPLNPRSAESPSPEPPSGADSPARRASSPQQASSAGGHTPARSNSPGRGASPARSGSPTRRAGSPTRRTGSPLRRAVSPARRAASPVRRGGGSPLAADSGAARRQHFAALASHPPPTATAAAGVVHAELRFHRLVDMPDRNGRTALMAAAAAGAEGCAEAVLAVGADPEARDVFWATAVERAIAAEQGAILAMIERSIAEFEQLAAEPAAQVYSEKISSSVGRDPVDALGPGAAQDHQ